MDIILKNRELVSILLTALIGALAWFCKELIDTPIKQSRETFFKILEKRVGSLKELYNYISIIALFPSDKNIKEELQKIILSDKMAYIDEDLSINIMKIAFYECTDETLLLSTQKKLQEAIAQCANKIQKENQYFISNDSPNTYKRIIVYFKQFIKVIIFVASILISIYYYIKLIIWKPLWLGLLFVGLAICIIRFFKKNKPQNTKRKIQKTKRKYIRTPVHH